MNNDKNSNENKTTPPVELTDEQLEAAAGGTATSEEDQAMEEELAQQWAAQALIDNYTFGPYLHKSNDPSPCNKNAKYSKEVGVIVRANGGFITHYKTKCFNCNIEWDRYVS